MFPQAFCEVQKVPKSTAAGRVARFAKPKYRRFFEPGNGPSMATNVVLVVRFSKY